MDEKIKQDISIGTNLSEIRKVKQLTQEQVVARLQTYGLSVSREMLSQMERGVYSIRVSTLIALKHMYDVDYNAFFAGLELPGISD